MGRKAAGLVQKFLFFVNDHSTWFRTAASLSIRPSSVEAFFSQTSPCSLGADAAEHSSFAGPDARADIDPRTSSSGGYPVIRLELYHRQDPSAFLRSFL
jgi:hypothetical protein